MEPNGVHYQPGSKKFRPKTIEMPSRRQKGLCEVCSSVGISPSAFLISRRYLAATPLRSQHVALNESSSKSVPVIQARALRSGHVDTPLPDYATIRSNSIDGHCGLCGLIYTAIEDYGGVGDDDQADCHVRWEVDGHEEADPSSVVNRTRRLRLSWKQLVNDRLRTKEAFLVILAHTEEDAPNSEAVSVTHRDKIFQGKAIEHEKGKQALLLSWIKSCHDNHEGVCTVRVTQDDTLKALSQETFFGVIDVTDLQLKPLPFTRKGRPEKYVALSYVWGNVKPELYRTDRTNILHRLQHGGLEKEFNKFPVVIRDAISLVQKLNYRYLWIDALCIVQGSSSSFRSNAAIMHTIYGNASFTICAADGQGADTGLVAMNEHARANTKPQIQAEVLPGLTLQVVRPPEMVIQDSKWNTRGWTYQERILSRRCIIFAEGRAYFQCRKSSFSEDTHNDITGRGYSLQAMQAPLRNVPEIEKRAMSFYMKSVAMFHRRDLGRAEDILPAYKGLESILIKRLNAPFCFGLPTSHFDLALLWQPKSAIRRREIKGDMVKEFPSWSWCGWIGGDVAYDNAYLEGCLLNVQEWLREHTWIRWHICGGTGHLRPLWNSCKVSGDLSLEERWRGYAGDKPMEYETETQSTLDALSERPPSQKSDEIIVIEEHDSPSRGYNGHDDLNQPPVRYRSRRVHRTPERSRERSRDRALPIIEYTRSKEDQYLDVEYRHVGPPPGISLARPKGGDGYKWLNQKGPQEQNLGRRNRTRQRYSEEDSSDADDNGLDRADRRELETATRAKQAQQGREPINPLKPQPPATDDYVELDSWGRPVSRYSPRVLATLNHFDLVHPENPYRVKRTPWQWLQETKGYQILDDLPILQFWTSHQWLGIVAAEHNPDTGLSRCHVTDPAGDWCGSVEVNTDWAMKHDNEVVEFIAISDAKSFTKAELPVWTYYTPHEQVESEWEACYALLVEQNPRKHLYERVALGKIFKDAFNGAYWDQIMLG